MKKYLTVFLAVILAGCAASSGSETITETAAAETPLPTAEPEQEKETSKPEESRTDSGNGMTIVLPETFTVQDMSDQEDSYAFYAVSESTAETVMARCISRDAMILITGRDDLSAAEFAEAYSRNTPVVSEDGFAWTEHTDDSYSMIMAFFAGESGYWNMSVMCAPEAYEEKKEAMLDYARSVRFYAYDTAEERTYEKLHITLPSEMEETAEADYVLYALGGCAVNISRREKGQSSAEELLSETAQEYGAKAVHDGEVTYIVYLSEDTGYRNLMTAAESGQDIYTVVFMAPEETADAAEPLFVKYAGTIRTE